ncbi:hypothetical protein FQN57_003027 [Myotisia sp. PD_48]|nr:hypothetical protein FQN57_003027 [Myotisia sp. PD_48]
MASQDWKISRSKYNLLRKLETVADESLWNMVDTLSERMEVSEGLILEGRISHNIHTQDSKEEHIYEFVVTNSAQPKRAPIIVVTASMKPPGYHLKKALRRLFKALYKQLRE